MASTLASGTILAERASKASAIPKRTLRHRRDSLLIYIGKLVRLAGIEPTTLGFGGQYSIH